MMTDTKKPELPPRASMTSGSTVNLPMGSAARNRLQDRQSTRATPSNSPKPDLSRRRSSLLSYSSLEDLTRTITDDIVDPSISRSGHARPENEVTHWHSAPLAFAVLPAVGGLLFKNGSAFTTDALLLILAAIFMNWSIRLPWDWYYSAQSLRQGVELDDDVIADELETDETAVESASSAESSPKQAAEALNGSPTRGVGRREKAAADLRKQELLALLATFIFPILAAYLLHVVRSQLSRPSSGLVSDYNLSIYVLAAEICPVRQLVRLVSSRTLHLQRVVSGLDDPFASGASDKNTANSLASRVAELESKLSDHTIVPQAVTIAQKADVSDLSTEMKKRYEPRLEGLERAVRRYEKRQTTLAMLTEQRLQSLETRLQDALSLAAVAAQHSQKPDVIASFLETISTIITWPIKMAWALAIWPLHITEDLYAKLKTMMLGPMPPRSSKRGGNGKASVSKDDRPRDKAAMRKIVR